MMKVAVKFIFEIWELFSWLSVTYDFFSPLSEFQNSKDFCSVTVGGEEIPNMPPEMQLKVDLKLPKQDTPEVFYFFALFWNSDLITLIFLALQVLHSALYTFDLIESVLARVEELIEIKTKSTSGENTGIKWKLHFLKKKKVSKILYSNMI